MKDMQAHARKIRSDAAECLVLSNLVTEERRHLFGRIAEHLNSLALEIETETVTGAPNEPSPAPDPHVNFPDQPVVPTDQKQTVRSWRLLPLSLLVVLIIIAGAVLWAVNRAEFTFPSLLPKNRAKSQASALDLSTLFSEERKERRIFGDQLSAIITRLDSLIKDLDDLKASQVGIAAPPTRGGQEDPSLGKEATPPAAEETITRAETSGASSAPSAPALTKDPAPSNNSPPSGEASDQVGTISTARTEPDPRKLTIGPAGCTRFRSFDPVSGTYTTFDGRRRQCR